MNGRMVQVNLVAGYSQFDSRYVVMCDTEEIINLETARAVKGKMLRDKDGVSVSVSRKRLIAAAKEHRLLMRKLMNLKTDEELEQMYAAVLEEVRHENKS